LQVVERRYGYRSPGQVLELASRLLPMAAPQVRPTEAVRRGRSDPRHVHAAPDELVGTAAAEAVSLADQWPTVAVIAPGSLVEPLTRQVRERTGDVGEATRDGLGHRITVVATEVAKGLEFDAVVVVEPDRITRQRLDAATGLRLLYVAMTRPTQHLSIVAASPLPGGLAA
jgi:DNA helicase IV